MMMMYDCAQWRKTRRIRNGKSVSGGEEGVEEGGGVGGGGEKLQVKNEEEKAV